MDSAATIPEVPLETPKSPDAHTTPEMPLEASKHPKKFRKVSKKSSPKSSEGSRKWLTMFLIIGAIIIIALIVGALYQYSITKSTESDVSERTTMDSSTTASPTGITNTTKPTGTTTTTGSSNTTTNNITTTYDATTGTTKTSSTTNGIPRSAPIPTSPPPSPAAIPTYPPPVSNPCFDGDGQIKMFDGGKKLVKDLNIGDEVLTHNQNCARVVYIIKTGIRPTPLCKINGLYITPYHPVLINGAWKYPIDVSERESNSVATIYSLVISNDHAVIVNDTPVITLGHGFNDPVAKHEYLGTGRVVKDLELIAVDGIIENPTIVRDIDTDTIVGLYR